ncbi:MAG: Rrf2 family transcriptional regulator [Solirubrobacteraceae bacterium]|nr:Rrf2 family transcriptional regulator [Solirubrobacteraceae bacterium]
MLSITAKSPYAVQALTELGRAGGTTTPVPVAELARRRDIPGQFLEQLFATLRRAGLLRSQRGVHGGYLLTRDPREITILEIVEMLDGPLGQDSVGIFADVAEAAREVLASTSVQDLIDREAREQGQTMYWI